MIYALKTMSDNKIYYASRSFADVVDYLINYLDFYTASSSFFDVFYIDYV